MNLKDLQNLDLNDLRNLDVNNMGSWPVAGRAFVLILAFAALCAGGWFYFIKDKLVTLEEAEQEEQTLRDEFASKQARAANLEAYKAQLEEMQRSFGAMLRQLPGRTEVENLVVDISQTALSSGLQQELFKPEGEQPRDFYAELPIKMRLTGSYHQFGAFASGVASLPRIVTLHDISITPVNEAQRGEGKGPLVMEVTAKTYRYLDTEEQAAQDAAQNAQRRR